MLEIQCIVNLDRSHVTSSPESPSIGTFLEALELG